MSLQVVEGALKSNTRLCQKRSLITSTQFLCSSRGVSETALLLGSFVTYVHLTGTTSREPCNKVPRVDRDGRVRFRIRYNALLLLNCKAGAQQNIGFSNVDSYANKLHTCCRNT